MEVSTHVNKIGEKKSNTEMSKVWLSPLGEPSINNDDDDDNNNK